MEENVILAENTERTLEMVVFLLSNVQNKPNLWPKNTQYKPNCGLAEPLHPIYIHILTYTCCKKNLDISKIWCAKICLKLLGWRTPLIFIITPLLDASLSPDQFLDLFLKVLFGLVTLIPSPLALFTTSTWLNTFIISLAIINIEACWERKSQWNCSEGWNGASDSSFRMYIHLH